MDRLAGLEYGRNVSPPRAADLFIGVSVTAASDDPLLCLIQTGGWRLSKPKKSCYLEQIDPKT